MSASQSFNYAVTHSLFPCDRIDVADEDIKAALFRKTELKADVDLSALETTQVHVPLMCMKVVLQQCEDPVLC